MKLTFFGGINEIGGNKILLEADGTRLFLDFGKSYKESSKYFEEFLNPRVVHGLTDYFEMGLTPKIEGIYRRDLLTITSSIQSVPMHKKPFIDAVLLSHGHLDHAGYISFIDPGIPIYTSVETLAVLKAFNISRPKNLENEIVEWADRSITDVKFRKKTKRKIITFENQKTFTIGNLQITPYCIDHSVPGASMFLIKTKDKKILYSGDFRLSEISEGQKREIYRVLGGEHIDIMLCEGTRIKEEKALKEERVYDLAKERVDKVKGLVVADYSVSDIVRFKTLSRLAKETKRFFALPYNYFNYLCVLKSEGVDVGDLSHIVLYAKQKITLQKWEKELLINNKNCLSSDISKNQRDYMVALNFYQVQELIDWKVDSDSYYLRAITEPHSEEMEISEQRFINWIDHFGLQGVNHEIDEKTGEKKGVFERAHISGHISGIELKEVLENIKPKMLIPIHTEFPDYFKEIYDSDKINLVKKGETLDI